MKKQLFACSLALSLLCANTFSYAQALESAPADEAELLTLEEITDSFYSDVMSSSPVNLHFSYLLDCPYEVSWAEPLGMFYESNAESLDILDRVSEKLDRLDFDSMDKRDYEVYTWLRNYIELQYDLYELPDYFPTLSPMDGIISSLDTIISEYAIISATDVEDFLKLLSDIPRFLDEVQKELDYQATLGFVPSASAYKQMLERETELCTPENHFYLEAFERNLAESGLDEAARADALSRADKILREEIIPAFSAFFRVLEEQAKTAGEDHGLCFYDNGREYYAALVRNNTGTDMTPEELAAYLEAKMSSEYSKLIQAYGKLDSFDDLEKLEYPTSTAEETLDWLKACTQERMPAVDLPGYTLSYLPPGLQVEGNLAYYLNAPLDLTTRNIIRINGSEVTDDDPQTLWLTMAHEGYPGHLYQYQYFLQNVCRYPAETLLGAIGSSEGWAYYVERMALTWLGLDEAVVDAIFIEEALSMAIMCRIDIGVNYEGWDYADINSFISSYYGEMDDETLKYFYETCAISPGAFLPYGVGYYKTCDLFDAMRDSYDSDVDMYAAYLSLGEMPFSLLELYLLP